MKPRYSFEPHHTDRLSLETVYAKIQPEGFSTYKSPSFTMDLL